MLRLLALLLIALSVTPVAAQNLPPQEPTRILEVEWAGKHRTATLDYCGRVVIPPGTRGLYLWLGNKAGTWLVAWDRVIGPDGFPCDQAYDEVPITSLRVTGIRELR